MSSIIYNSCLSSIFKSTIHFDTDRFKIMLVSSSYKPNKDHSKRSDVLGELPTGNGYNLGGLDVNVNIRNEVENNRINVNLGGVTWSNATITAGGAIYYKVGHGGRDNDDLICFVEFDKEASSVNSSFTITPSILRVQN